jgi:hypothetical protein
VETPILELDFGRWRLGVGALLLRAEACQTPAQIPNPSQPVAQRQSDKTQRRSVAITVYDPELRLGARNATAQRSRSGAARSSSRSKTSALRGATPGAQLNELDVLEQEYRYELLTPSKSLEKYVGCFVALYCYDPKTGIEIKKRGRGAAVEGGVTWHIDGELTSNVRGRVAFSEVPRDLLDKPTLAP